MLYDVYGNKYDARMLSNYSQLLEELNMRMAQIRQTKEKKHSIQLYPQQSPSTNLTTKNDMQCSLKNFYDTSSPKSTA